MTVFASILTPIREFFGDPRLPWVLLWVGLTALIVALIVMIRTSWGQSNPLRKCAGLSLLAHLLLACYATTVEIVMATGIAPHREPLAIVLVDGDEDFEADPSDDIANPKAESELAESTVPEAGDNPRQESPREIAQRTAEAPADLPDEPPLLDSAVEHPTLPPLLDVVEQRSKTMPPERLDVLPPSEQVAEKPQESPSIEPNAPELAPANVTASKTPTPPEKPSEPLPPVDTAAPLPKLPELADTSEPSDWQSGLPAPATSSVQTAQQGPTSQSTNSGQPTAPPSASTADGPQIESANPPLASNKAPAIYSDRLAEDRLAVARSRGGSPQSEAAVQSALRFLAANQNADGRWEAARFGAGRETKVLGHDREGAGGRADTGITGLALLAFLGAGNTHLEGEYAKTVQRGLEFLLESQAASGSLAGQSEKFAAMYSHGMAALAISEAYAMTGDDRLENAVRAAIDYTISAQLPASGGWRYQVSDRRTPTELGDTSQLGWQLMALKSAELAGVQVPGRVTDGASKYLRLVSSGQFGGKASYQPGPPRPSTAMTAEALVCRQFLGVDRRNPACNEAGDYLLHDLPNPQKVNLYYWYYGTLGMFQLQGPHWQQWNHAMQTTLVSRQRTDGAMAGSWDPDCLWGGYGGRIYSTALATLCLEVYYRYLPLYRENQQPQTAVQPIAPHRH